MSAEALHRARLDAGRRPQQQQQIARIHALGSRVLAELIAELDREHDIGADLDNRLARYAALRPEIVRAVGADRFPAAPLHIVASSAR